MLQSTMVLFNSTHDVLTEEVWMGGDFLSSNVRHIPGFEHAFDNGEWRPFLRDLMKRVNSDPDSFENVTRIIAIHDGHSFLIEKGND